MATKNNSYVGNKDSLRRAIESGTYERMGLSERATQNNHYLGRVPNYGGSRGRGRGSR